MLVARDLTQRYHGLKVLDTVSFEVAAGEIFGYVGANGCGKSTTVRILVGLQEPTRGVTLIDGIAHTDDPIAYKTIVGYVPEEAAVYRHLTATEYLQLIARLRGIDRPTARERIGALLDALNLSNAAHLLLSEFSKGMRQRVVLSGALLHNPKVLVLDEPFSGLDLSGAQFVRSALTALARTGTAIFCSSHRLDMVESLCHRVALVDHGRLVACDTPSAIRKTFSATSLSDALGLVLNTDDETRAGEAMVEALALGASTRLGRGTGSLRAGAR